MRPLKDYVLAVQAEIEQKTASGLILTGDLESGSKPGIVKAIGPDVTTVSVGDKIAVKWPEGLPVSLNGTQAALLPEEAIFAVYN